MPTRSGLPRPIVRRRTKASWPPPPAPAARIANRPLTRMWFFPHVWYDRVVPTAPPGARELSIHAMLCRLVDYCHRLAETVTRSDGRAVGGVPHDLMLLQNCVIAA